MRLGSEHTLDGPSNLEHAPLREVLGKDLATDGQPIHATDRQR